MTPEAVLAHLRARGFHLGLRAGRLHLSRTHSGSEPKPEDWELIHEHRAALIDYLEEFEAAYAAHQASLEAGRITSVPPWVKRILATWEPPP